MNWMVPQSCIADGTIEGWPEIDFDEFDVIIVVASTGSACGGCLIVDGLEDCGDERTVDGAYYYSGPCEAVWLDYQSFTVPKGTVDPTFALVEHEESECPG